jgi:hypothetical protein
LAPLLPFAENIWLAEGSEVSVAGFRFPTRAAVIKLTDGTLFIWSPIHLSAELRDAIDALGIVRHIVAPNSLHHLFLPEWKQAYPGAVLYAPPGLREKRKDIAFDADITASVPWASEIDHIAMSGNRITTEIVFFHRTSGTVLFTDLLQQIPPHMVRGWRALVARLDKMTGSEPQVPHKFRFAFTDRAAGRAALRTILAWPVEKVVMAHGMPVEHDAGVYLRRAFAWLD